MMTTATNMTTITVPSDNGFRASVAQNIVKELCGDVQGDYYVDPLSWEIYYKEQNAPWNPWRDSVSVIPLTDLAPGAIDVDDEVDDWESALFSKEYTLEDISQEYLASDPEIPLIEWAREHEEFASVIEECEDEARQNAISFVLEEILEEFELDEVEIEE